MATDPPAPRRAHSCVVCDFPIAVYGRLTPCSHAFCAECAAALPVCYLCNARVARVETVRRAWVSPITMQAFDSEQELARHVAEAHARLLAGPAAAAARSWGAGRGRGGGAQQQQAPAALPWRG